MKNTVLTIGLRLVSIPALLLLGACNSADGDLAAEAPRPTTVLPDADVSLFSVDHPEQFPFTAAVAYGTLGAASAIRNFAVPQTGVCTHSENDWAQCENSGRGQNTRLDPSTSEFCFILINV